MSGYLGSFIIDDTCTFYTNAHTPSTGAAVDADAVPGYRVYEDETTAPILTGSMALLDDGNTVGFYSEQITLSAANGFEAGKSYCVRITIVVGGVTGTQLQTLQIGARVDMRMLGGGLQSATDLKDFADDGYDPATNKVQGVVLTDTVTTYTGNTPQTGDSFARLGAPAGASVSADIAAIQADTEDIQARLPAALTAGGNMKSDALAISGDATAADRLEALMDGIIVAQVNDAGATTTVFIADGFTEATNDHFNGRLITFLTGVLAAQQTMITDYVGATQTLTVEALTEAPGNNDFFVIH